MQTRLVASLWASLLTGMLLLDLVLFLPVVLAAWDRLLPSCVALALPPVDKRSSFYTRDWLLVMNMDC